MSGSLLMTDNAIVTRSGLTESTSSLKISLDGRAVRHPRLMTVKVENRSSREIRAADYDGGSASLTVNGTVLAVTTTSASDPLLEFPASVRGFREVDDGRSVVEFAPSLLNPGDWVCFQIVLDGEPGLAASARIAGQTEKVRTTTSQDESATSTDWVVVALGAVIIVGTILAAVDPAVAQVMLGAIHSVMTPLGVALILLRIRPVRRRLRLWRNRYRTWRTAPATPAAAQAVSRSRS